MITTIPTTANKAPLANAEPPQTAQASSGQTETAPHLKQTVDLKTAVEGTKSAQIPLTTSVYSDSSTPGAPSPSGTAPEPMSGHTLNVGGLMNGKLVTQLMDAVIPALATAILYRFGVKIKKSEIQMSAKEIDLLAPIVQDCLNTVNANMSSPWQSLGVALLVIYGAKIGEKSAIQWADRLKNADTEERPSEPVKTPEQVLKDLKETEVQFTEAEIDAERKRAKVGRDRAIILLKRKKEATK